MVAVVAEIVGMVAAAAAGYLVGRSNQAQSAASSVVPFGLRRFSLIDVSGRQVSFMGIDVVAVEYHPLFGYAEAPLYVVVLTTQVRYNVLPELMHEFLAAWEAQPGAKG